MALSRTPLALTAAFAAAVSLAACSGADPDSTEPVVTSDASATTPAPTTAAAEPTGPAVRPDLPAQTVGALADCSMWDFASLEAIWGVPFTDTDDNQVIELNGPGTQRYSCDYNETDSGLGLTVVVEFEQYLTEAEAVQAMNDTRSGAVFGDTVYYVLEDVSGVGDEAFFSTNASDEANPAPVQTQIYARYGNLVVLGSALNLDGLDKAAAQDGLVATLTGGIG